MAIESKVVGRGAGGFIPKDFIPIVCQSCHTPLFYYDQTKIVPRGTISSKYARLPDGSFPVEGTALPVCECGGHADLSLRFEEH